MIGSAIPIRQTVSHSGAEPVDLAAASFESLVAEMLRRLGEDPHREGLQKTPARVHKSLRSLTDGYQKDPAEVVGDAIFHEDITEPVVVRDIEFYSLCEHHMLPFWGRVHIAYVPDGRIVGLSKLPRLVDVFARRLQVQERLTAQVADAVMALLTPRGAGVVTEASHMCMMMRGVRSQHSTTLCSAMRGAYHHDPRLRDELLRLSGAGGSRG